MIIVTNSGRFAMEAKSATLFQFDNPVFAYSDGTVAVDARMILEEAG